MYQINHKEIKRKKIKKVLLIISLIFVLWVTLGLYIRQITKNNKTLEKIGYSNIEISIIQDILSDKEIKNIYKYNYINSLTEILVSNNFNQKKLTNYLNYYNKYPNITSDDLIFIINNNLDNLVYNDFTKKLMHHESFNEDRMDRYNDYYNKYNLNVDDTVFAVNNDFDIYNIKYNKEHQKYMNNKNFIMSNLERYYNYSLKNKYLDVNTIISNVNINLDLIPYNKNNKADISKNYLILVNKYYYLDKNYVPNNLVEIDKSDGNGMIVNEVYEAFKKMNIDSTKNNIPLYIINGYISYKDQYNLYLSNNKLYDKPGYSELQTGLIIELQNNEWLENNSYKYGFIQRYPKDKKYITGYEKLNYYRYVGIDAAKIIYTNKLSYEEYYTYYVDKK